MILPNLMISDPESHILWGCIRTWRSNIRFSQNTSQVIVHERLVNHTSFKDFFRTYATVREYATWELSDFSKSEERNRQNSLDYAEVIIINLDRSFVAITLILNFWAYFHNIEQN